MTTTLADDAYRQDAIAPVRVEHRLEYGDAVGFDADGEPCWGHSYNPLFYVFREGEAVAEATYDPDDGCALLRYLAPWGPDTDFGQRVLVFLTMRSAHVAIVQPCWGIVRLDACADLAGRAASRRRAHMQAAGERD